MGYEDRIRETFAAELPRLNNDPLSTLIATFIQTNAVEPGLLNFILREAKVDSDHRYYIADNYVCSFADVLAAISERPANRQFSQDGVDKWQHHISVKCLDLMRIKWPRRFILPAPNATQRTACRRSA